ncbi:MAG: ABC transporter ATP-binding protein [Candidatus Omnitrophota bacterium]
MLLEIKNLKVSYFGADMPTDAVNGANLSISEGEVLALVGESACGKSTLALSIAKLISPRDGRITDGEIIFNNKDVMRLSCDELRDLRGKELSYIFQEPASSLNPVFTIGQQITEVLLTHTKTTKLQAKTKALDVLSLAQLADPERIFSSYPHQLSGGMKQRAMIAMATVLKPKLLIADEPTTALDVTVQAKIIELLKRLKADLGLSILFITHDLNLVSTIADRIAVMYKGKIVEVCERKEFYSSPKHDYTKMLLTTLKDLKDVKSKSA